MRGTWLPVLTAAEIPSDRGRLVFADGRTIVLFKVDGAIHALDDSCPHAGSSLAAGKLEGAFVQCRAHGLRFDFGRADQFSAEALEQVAAILDGDRS